MSPRFRDGVDHRARRHAPALLLVNLGTPDAPTAGAVRRYLGEFLHDYRVVELTRWLWCPILHGMILPLRIAQGGAEVRQHLDRQGLAPAGAEPRPGRGDAGADARIRGAPGHALRQAGHRAEYCRTCTTRGMQRLLVLPLYPQYSASTVASVHDAVFAELRQLAGAARTAPDQRLPPG